MDTDYKLIKRMRQGDDAAFNIFIHKYYTDILRYCTYHCYDSEEAKDLTQDTFLRFFAGFSGYTHSGKAKNYLYTIAGNLCKNYYKKARGRSGEALDEGILLEDLEDELTSQITVRMGLDRLPEELREVIILYYYQGLKQTEIASILGIGLPLVTMLLYATTGSLILIIVIGFLSAGIFAEEFQYKADAVFFSTRHGRSNAVYAKICAGLIVVTLVYWIGIGVLSAISFAFIGISGAATTYRFSRPYAVYSVTFGQMYGILVLGGYIASLLAASVAMLIASKTRAMSIAAVVPFVLFCVSPFIGRVLPFRTFFSLTPDQLTNILNCARIPYIYQIGNVVFRQIPFIIVFYAVLAAGLLPLIYRNFHRLLLK